MKTLSGPKEASIRLTNACNARCQMCEIWKEQELSELNTSLLRQLPCSLTNISLVGGEPFLHNDLLDIINELKTYCKKSRIVISTNGILTDLIIEQVKKIIRIEAKLAIRLSLDGIAETNDNIRGVKNAYFKVIDTLKALQALGIRDLGITITIIDENISQVSNIFRLAKEKKIKFNCQIAHSAEFYYKKNNPQISQKDSLKEQLNLVISSELRSFNLQRLFKAYYYRGIWNYVNHLPRTYPCNAGKSFFYLDQKGDIYPCLFLDKPMGNLYQESFPTIWNGQLANEIREYVTGCSINCWVICTAAPAIKNKPFRAAKWVLPNKLSAHFGKNSYCETAI